MIADESPIPEGILKAGGILDEIVEAKLIRLDRAKRGRAEPGWSRVRESRSEDGPRRFWEALSRFDRVNIIAEIKMRSPSRGLLCERFDPVAIARAYEAGGAAALSVLTEEDFFGGSLDHLRAVRDRVGLPLLRKDFIFDPYQIHESAEAGADAVLLIAALLEGSLLSSLCSLASELGLEAFVEVHDEDEMDRAASAGARVIGVNNRDLRTFAVDLETSLRVARAAPTGALLVSESGISRGQDISYLRGAGFSAFLVGERLMTAAEPGVALRGLVVDAEKLEAGGPDRAGRI